MMDKSPNIRPDILTSIRTDPLAAGMEPGSDLQQAILITTWRQPAGQGRIAVQPATSPLPASEIVIMLTTAIVGTVVLAERGTDAPD